MNQILSNQFFPPNKETKPLKNLKIIFWFSIFIIFICILFFIYLRYNSIQKEKLAKNLENKFEIRKLYSENTDNYSASLLSSTSTSPQPFVIGLIKIDKINLMYPILSESSDELLEISPCRFYGPMPNEAGNMCIAGHNYANQTHFAKLHYLNPGDKIYVYDLNGNSLEYLIYSKEEMPSDDVSCLNQETNSLREITLVTCNTIKGNRIVIKAKENEI